MLRLALLALFTLPLAACETEPDPNEASPYDEGFTEGAMTDEPVVGPVADDVTPESTLEAADMAGGLTQLAVPAAVTNIESWIASLEGTPGAENVVENLRTLRDQLQTTPIDGNAVGMTLIELGNETTSLAAGDTRLERLGSMLTEAGQQLTGGSM